MIEIDVSDPTPPFDQVRAQLADQIRGGSLADGTRLPSVRQLAADLRLAPGTVARAYAALEAEGFVSTGRTGTTVRAGNAMPPGVRRAAQRFVAALPRGVTIDEAFSAVRAEWGARG